MYKHVQKVLHSGNCPKPKRNGSLHLSLMLYHSSGETQEEVLPFEWYEKVFPKITKLTHQLKHVDLIDGRLVNIKDDSIIIDEYIQNKMQTLKSLVRVFVGSPSVQQKVRENLKGLSVDAKCRNPVGCFSKSSEREAMIVDSLDKVSNFLNVSAQQRKLVRLTICQQVTQHQIWRGVLEEILNELKSEMDLLNYDYVGKGSNMGYQIVSSCLKFLADTGTSCDHDSTSWMRLAPAKAAGSPSRCKWEDVLEMFHDLSGCLKGEKWLVHHVGKLEAMKEGLSQIKDVSIDRSLGYKEVRHQESLVQKKLSNALGHSSRCLFTLLLYYLFGHVRDVEVDLCGGIYGSDGKDRLCLCMGRILTSDDEKMVWNGMKQLDRALRIFKFVWEIAGMKGVLELKGHLWCVGAKDRTLTYRGNVFFLHGISL